MKPFVKEQKFSLPANIPFFLALRAKSVTAYEQLIIFEVTYEICCLQNI